MDPSYQTDYRFKKINPHKLIEKIGRKYDNYNVKQEFSYEEILFILDQECEYEKCDRDVVRQLFQQSANPQNKATLNQIIFKYVQNLQTSKLCLIRQQNSVKSIKQRLNSLKGNTKSYVYLKLIQATVHARFSSTPSLTYKIQPSNIPPVTIVNSLNPILNDQYTLQMETNSFKIIFYESGVSIFEWEWPDCPESNKAGEYHRKVVGQSLSFEVKLKYSPINSNPERKPLEDQLEIKESQMETQYSAFAKLCNFQPFLSDVPRREFIPTHDDSVSKKFTQTLVQCLPFLSNHVRNLYYVMIFLIIVECLAAMSWPMQFLDVSDRYMQIVLIFGIIAQLMDKQDQDLGMALWMAIMGFALLIVKSIWGAVVKNLNGPKLIVFLVIAIFMKILSLFFIWFCAVRKDEIPFQRRQTFYNRVDPKARQRIRMQEERKEKSTIWM